MIRDYTRATTFTRIDIQFIFVLRCKEDFTLLARLSVLSFLSFSERTFEARLSKFRFFPGEPGGLNTPAPSGCSGDTSSAITSRG